MNFDVAIEPLSSGYRARVVASPTGEATVDFTLPFTDQDLELFVLKVVGSKQQVTKTRRLRRTDGDGTG